MNQEDYIASNLITKDKRGTKEKGKCDRRVDTVESITTKRVSVGRKLKSVLSVEAQSI